jgi:type I restriction enzyme, S subunit
MNETSGLKPTEAGFVPSDWSVTSIEDVSYLVTNGFVGTASPYHTEDGTGVIYIQGYKWACPPLVDT